MRRIKPHTAFIKPLTAMCARRAHEAGCELWQRSSNGWAVKSPKGHWVYLRDIAAVEAVLDIIEDYSIGRDAL